jgi:methylated-DNA-[protein]-cysteine S-methyltransferase
MNKERKFNVFLTKWGYFAFSGSPGKGISASVLPKEDREATIRRVCAKSGAEIFDETLFPMLKKRILRYFEGQRVDFTSGIIIDFGGCDTFRKNVLTACRRIKFGETACYSEIARNCGSPQAARAVGNSLSKNPLPLIIPCHRVIRSDGEPGGFAEGGDMKIRLIQHEKNIG